MERKFTSFLRVTLVVLALAFSVVSSALAATSTVGTGGLKGNGTSSMNALPAQMGTPSCFTVKLTTNSFTLILSSDAARADFWIVNVSTNDMGAAGPFQRPPIVWISTTNAPNIGSFGAGTTFPLSNLPLLNATPLYGCNPLTISGRSPNGNCSFPPSRNTSVWTGAIYGIAESSTTIAYDPLPYVQGCVLKP